MISASFWSIYRTISLQMNFGFWCWNLVETEFKSTNTSDAMYMNYFKKQQQIHTRNNTKKSHFCCCRYSFSPSVVSEIYLSIITEGEKLHILQILSFCSLLLLLLLSPKLCVWCMYIESRFSYIYMHYYYYYYLRCVW